MSIRKRALALLLTTALLVTCAFAGITLPVAATAGNTFKLAVDEYVIAPSPTSSVYVYGAVAPLNLDGTPYVEDVTWTSGNTSLINFGSTPGVFYSVYGASGTTTITATNAAGESHSCAVTIAFDGEVIPSGDFESNGINTTKWTTNLIKAEKGEVVEEADGNHVLMMPAGVAPVMMYSLPVYPGVTYQLSFDVKGAPSTTQAVYVTNVSSGGGTKTLNPKADSLTGYTYKFTIKDSGYNRSSTLAFGNKATSAPIYFDNISLTALGTAESIALNTTTLNLGIGDTSTLTVAPSPADATFNRVQWSSSNESVATVDKNGNVTAIASGSATITAKSGTLEAAECVITVVDDLLKVTPDSDLKNGTITTDAIPGILKPNDNVTVTVTPDEGYLMVPGTLKYVLKDGTEIPILNETLTSDPVFGRESAGNTFQFAMPEQTVTVTAEFISDKQQNFSANTVATSFHYVYNEKGEKQYDGVRFLTRLNLANKFDTDSGTLIVTYGGAEYTVLEFGSLLKRKQNATALTYENALANQNAADTNKMWISKAFTAESGVFKLVDYTKSYIDFAVIMMTAHHDRSYTARGYVRLQAADGTIVTLELDEISNSIGEIANKVTFNKTASHTVSQTVSPGKPVTYSITLTNAANQPVPVTVTDTVPDVAEYVSGCGNVAENLLTWNVILPANSTQTIRYTLKAKDDEANLSKALDGVAKVDGYVAPCNKIYIERTLGTTDQRLMNTAIDAFRQYTNFEGVNLLKMIWNVAMSKSVSYNDSNGKEMTPAQILNFIYTGEGEFGGSEGSGEEAATAAVDFRKAVIPTLFGGIGVTANQTEQFNGTQAANINAAELMAGDTFFVQESESDTVGKIYIYNGKRLFQLEKGVIDVNTNAVLSTIPNAYRYAGLRFSYVIANRKSFAEDKNDTLTEAQKAVVSIAEALLLRGDRAQYDAGSMMKPSGRSEYKDNAPEDYQSNSWKYTNCAMLTFDSYYFGIGKDTGSNWYTANIINSAKSQNIFYYEPTGTETDEEKQAQINKFYAALQPADTIVIRRKNDSGHAMLYTGNGIIIHSTGGSYLPADNSGKGTGVEQYEATVRYLDAYNFFDPKSDNGGAYSYYAFGGQVTKIGIYRPLKSFSGSIPQETVNRMSNLSGIAVEKVASKHTSQTVNVGDEITYTFKFLNTGDEDKTLAITDVVPAGTTLVSAEGATVNNTDLAWTITVPADEKCELSYTVSVDAASLGGKIESRSAVVGGVSVRANDLFVANTLTAEQQQALVNAAQSLSSSSKRSLELVNEIYTTAFGVKPIFEHTTLSTFHSQLFTLASDGERYTIADNQYGAMAAPTLYGGRKFYSTDVGEYGRQSRLAREDDLIVGDILFGRTSSSSTVYIYLGNGVCWSLSTNKEDTVSVSGRMERFVGYVNYWAILRPSMVMEVAE